MVLLMCAFILQDIKPQIVARRRGRERRITSYRGVHGVGSNPARDQVFILDFFAPFSFLKTQRSPCKWNQAYPFVCSYCGFRPQIRLIMQDLCIIWPQYSFIANWLEAKTIIFRYFLARFRNFPPQVDQKVHQVLQNLPQAFCIGDVIRYDSIKPEKTIKSKICKIIIKLYISENLSKK